MIEYSVKKVVEGKEIFHLGMGNIESFFVFAATVTGLES